MSPHYFYVYYDEEAYIDDLHGLSYRGPNQKQTLIEVKRGIHTRKLKWKIMSTMGLDKDTHDISIVFRAPQQLVGTQVFYNSILLQCKYNVGSDKAGRAIHSFWLVCNCPHCWVQCRRGFVICQ